MPPSRRGIVAGVAGVVAVIMLWLLGREMLPHSAPRMLTLTQDSTGEVTVSYDTLAKVAEQASLGVARVGTARCRVTMRDGELRVRCHTAADPFSDAAFVGQQVEVAIRTQLERTLGKPISHVAVQVELEKPGTPVRIR